MMNLDETELERRLLERAGARTSVAAAARLAAEAHAGRTRDDGTPYIRHPLRVALILVDELGIADADLVCAALLHDVLEDNPAIGAPRLAREFGANVARLVECLTDEYKQSGLPRAERRRLYLSRFASEPDDCLLVKLCDRLDNLRSLPTSPHLDKRQYMTEETRRHFLPLFATRAGAFAILERQIQQALQALAP